MSPARRYRERGDASDAAATRSVFIRYSTSIDGGEEGGKRMVYLWKDHLARG